MLECLSLVSLSSLELWKSLNLLGRFVSYEEN
jgi:hypothetical protein